MKDFDLETYSLLLHTFQKAGYAFCTFAEWCRCKPDGKYIIMRHDIDKNPQNSLAIASIEANMGIRASYYFQAKRTLFIPSIIKQIATLNHEIGYHYTDFVESKGNPPKAIQLFTKHLQQFEAIIDVQTICMHGSPTSQWDNRSLWKHYNYKDYGIIGEPYLDINFDELYYITDTGRCWDGDKYSVRDKVKSAFKQRYHNTAQIISAVNSGSFPTQLMMTTHPQRWTNNVANWYVELVTQKLKNDIKRLVLIKP